MIKLITTDSYYNLFPILNNLLKGKVNTLGGKNLIFCEEKVSLMAERSIMSQFNGSFNTAVYSFGNFLRAKMPRTALTKEGSAMAVKRVLSSVNLTCFKSSKTSLAPALYDLIIQLKSAKVKPSDLLNASKYAYGTLKNKLLDIYAIYSGYEQFILERNFDDQSSMLNYLPEIILGDDEIELSDVYILGFSGFTSQIRSAISALIKKAKSITAILTEGENELVYVNETANSFRELARRADKSLVEEKIKSDWCEEALLISQSVFNPCAYKSNKKPTDKIYTYSAENRMQEVERVAEIIKQKVLDGECRYRDITVALPDPIGYAGDIERAFNMLDLPYFLDQKKKVGSHPLIRLILTYIDAFRKNLERKTLSAFYKNPLFCSDKALSDEFENYVLAFNIDFNRIKKPFTFDNKGAFSLEELNEFRLKVVSVFNEFNPRKLLATLSVEEKLKDYSNKLRQMGEATESAVNEQVYSAVDRILTEMETMLLGVEMTLTEIKNVFSSGVSAMEISIIPQYNDAVFVGGLKECALSKAKHLFVLGLTSDLPAVKEDVALLSDGDISALEDIKVLVEPKIKIVNHRARENAGLALSAFSESLYLSYPLLNISGDKNTRSQALNDIEKIFEVRPFPKYKGYLSYRQGLSAFARACGEFATGRLNDFTPASSFYSAVGEENLKPLLDRSNQEVKIRLSSSREIMSKKYISPTRIEDYYKCPYRAFLSSGLKLKRREEGVVDGFSVGNIMHEIFGEYALNMDKVSDKISSDALVNAIAEKVLARQEYAKYLGDAITSNAVKSAVSECAKFCYKNYLAIENSDFKVKKTEAGFGDGKDCVYPAINLLDGKVKMLGKIDRVDENGEYFRVLDYKTASPNADLDLLFTGKKLQLYLYAKAVNHDKNNPKKLAGVYYMPVSDKFRAEGESLPALSKGITLSDSQVIKSQEKNIINGQSTFLPIEIKDEQIKVSGEMSEEGLSACVDYAVKLSENAVKRMNEGFIAPTPADERICGYCEYRELCPLSDPQARKHGKVDATTIIDAVKEDE